MITVLTRQETDTTFDAGSMVTVLADASLFVTDFGNPGPQGPAGSAGGSTQSISAGENLSGHRAVKVQGGLVYHCDAADAADIGKGIGITTGAVILGGMATVQTVGSHTEPSWAWTEGPVYAGTLGVLTQSVAGLEFIQQIGVATSATSIDINPQQAIRVV